MRDDQQRDERRRGGRFYDRWNLENKKLSAKLILNRNHKNNRWKLARGVFRKLSNLGINIRFLSIGGMEAKYKLAYCNE